MCQQELEQYNKLEKMAKELVNVIHQKNEINEELVNQIEELLSQYKKYYKFAYLSYPGQFISDYQASLFMAYTKALTVPILITDGKKVFANASGVILNLNKKFLVTNFHVYEAWENLNNKSKTFFQIGSISIPVENSIIDKNKSLDLISISVPDQLIEMVSNISYKKSYSPENWPFETEKGAIVVASGYPGKIREDYIELGLSHLNHGSITDQITDLTESKYIMKFNRDEWQQVLGIKDPNDLTDLGGFSGGPVFFCNNGTINLVGIIFEDGGDFFDGIRVVQSSLINGDGTISHQWGY